MSGPGGDQVAKVAVRVVPDTSGFRRDLQRDLAAAEAGLEVRVPVEFDVDVAGLRSQLAALDNSRVTIPVELDPNVAQLRTRLAALGNSRIVIPVDLDLQTAQLAAQLAALNNRRIRIDVQVTGVAAAIAELQTLEALVSSLDGRTIRINLNISGLVGALAQLAALAAALAALRGSGGLGGFNFGFGGLAGGIANAVQMAVRLGVALAQASAIATALAVAGAAITAAWGAASTAVAAVPAALALVAAPLGAVVLGLDGIKRAAATIKPQFDALRASISATFEQGLTPALQTLATGVLPKVEGGINAIAVSMTDMARSTADWLASTEGITLLQGVLANVDRTLKAMAPRLGDIGNAFLQLGNQSAAFDVLSGAVNAFGESFRANVEALIADGRMEQAFRGLSETLQLAGRGFSDLVHNGILVFLGAAPGVNAFLESLTGFFNRFDWTSLGTSVGGVFQGLATALDNVPQGTIDAIEASFARLAQTFQSADFQAQLQTMISAIPAAIDLINQLVQVFGTIGAAVANAVIAFQRIGTAVSGFANIMHGAALTILQFGRMIGNPVQAWLDRADIGAQFDRAGALVREGVAKVGEAFTAPWPSITSSAATGIAGVGNALITGAERSGVAAAGVLDTGIGEMNNAAERGLARTSSIVGTGLAPIPGQVGAALAPTPAAAGAALDPTAAAIGAALLPAETATTAALTRIQTALQTGFANLAPQVGTQLQGVLLTVTTSFSQMATIAQAGMIGVQTAMTAGTAGWALATGVAMQGVMLALTTGFAQMSTIATAGMLTVAVAITAGAIGWSLAVTNGFLQMQAAVTTGFATLAAIATNGMAIFAGAINIGFASVVAAVTAGMIAVQAAFVVNWAAVTAATTTAMAQMTAAVQTGMTQMVAASQQGWSQMTTAATDGATQMTNAITQGMNQSVAAVVSGVARMVNTLNAARGAFFTAGANMGQALADGLNSKAGAVEAAAARLANAAAAAVRAAAGIRSPSRVFIELGSYMGEGAAIGLESQEHRIIRAAASIVDGLNTEFSRVDTAPAFDDIGSRLHARVIQSSAEVDATLVGAGASGRTINNNVILQVPDAERGADRASHNLRRLSALGLFG